MFEYTCAKCQEPATVPTLVSGMVTSCANCGQRLRVVFDDEPGAGLSFVAPTPHASRSSRIRSESMDGRAVAAGSASVMTAEPGWNAGRSPTAERARTSTPPAPPLLRRTTCPHCWSKFAPADVLWISSHADLRGDPRLGPDELQRFLPTYFNTDGNAIDSRGFVCQRLACPKCHLPIPRILLENEPLFISIFGNPACGKSYYLTAMTWELRQLLPNHFGLSFTDADTVSNRSLNEYEEHLFLNARSKEEIPLADLIRKTELQGELYDTVMYGNQSVTYPRPFLFNLRPLETHPRRQEGERLDRVLCLYDNAGEHFQPGRDSTGSPVTQHLAQSRLLLFIYDPTQDQRFRKLCMNRGDIPAELLGERSSRQESILLEAAARVRQHTGLPENAKTRQSLIVAVTKADVWAKLLDKGDLREPWLPHNNLQGLDLEKIESRSQAVRALLWSVCPELITGAENFAHDVVYVPVSALGRLPSVQADKKALAIQPGQIQPLWVTVPLLYTLSRWVRGLVPGLRAKAGRAGGSDSVFDVSRAHQAN